MRPAHTLAMPLALLVCACGPPADGGGESLPAQASSPPARLLVLGKIAVDPVDKIAEWQPLADYLSSRLGPWSIDRVEARAFPDPEAMATALATGEVDLFFDNPFSTALVSSLSGSDYLLSRIKTGAASKHTVFFSRPGSGIDSLVELRGRVVALEEPDSASGYLLPYLHMLDAGLRPVEKSAPRSVVAADEVGLVFSGDDRNTMAWVLNGRVPAGAVDNETLESFARERPDRLVAFSATLPITRNQPGLVSATMTAELRSELKRLLLELPVEVTLPSGTLGFALVEEDLATVERLRRVLPAVGFDPSTGGDGAAGG